MHWRALGQESDTQQVQPYRDTAFHKGPSSPFFRPVGCARLCPAVGVAFVLDPSRGHSQCGHSQGTQGALPGGTVWSSESRNFDGKNSDFGASNILATVDPNK